MQDVEVNRLAKWGIGTVQKVVVSSAGVAVEQRIVFSPRLELDINSDSRATLLRNRLVQTV